MMSFDWTRGPMDIFGTNISRSLQIVGPLYEEGVFEKLRKEK